MSGFLEQNTTVHTTIATTIHHVVGNARSSNLTLVCVKDPTNYPHLVELSISVAVLPFHLFVLIAMLVHRDVVKRNLVNLYAGNVFVANIVMVSWRILLNAQMYNHPDTYTYEIVNGTVEHDDDDPAFIWWTFKKQFQLILLLVTCGSIGLVINVMRSSMFRLHRTVAGLTLRRSFGPSDKNRSNERKNPSCYKRMRRMVRKHPKAHAATLLIGVWIFPILLASMVVVLHVSYCDMKCRCVFDTFPVTDRQDVCEVDDNCSNVFPPVSIVLVAVGVALLTVYISLMGLMLYKTYRDFSNIVRQRLAEAALAKNDNELKSMENNSVAKIDQNSTVKEDQSISEHAPSEMDMKDEGRLDRGREASVRFAPQNRRKKSVPGSIFLQSGRTNLRLLFLMYGSYLIGVLPMVIYTMVDGFDSGQREVFTESPDSIAPLVGLPILSEFFCTVILCVHLSGIKSATRLLLVTLVGCVTKRTN